MRLKDGLQNGRSKYVLMLYLFLLPGVMLLVIFNIIPMVGLVMAFQKYVPTKGMLHSKFVGLDNFRFLLSLPDVWEIIRNTIIIAVSKIAGNAIVSIMLSLFLFELSSKRFRKCIQTIIYIPHFISWVALSGIILTMFELGGPVNNIITAFGGDEIMFFGNNTWARPIIIMSDIVKEAGFGTIVYLAALTGINPALFEVAELEGANRWDRYKYIMLPSIKTTVILMITLNIGNILNAGFDQILNLYNPLIYETVDVIDTYVYRMGLESMQFSFATAVGLIKSFFGFSLMMLANWLANKFTNYRIL